MKAYPFQHRHPTTGVTTSSEGMDLRDYFAGQAIDKCPLNNHTDAAAWCYARADAMLKARETKDEQS